MRVRRLRASSGAERARSRQVGYASRQAATMDSGQARRCGVDRFHVPAPLYACCFLIVSFRAFLIGAPSHRSLSSSPFCSSIRKALLSATTVSKGSSL